VVKAPGRWFSSTLRARGSARHPRRWRRSHRADARPMPLPPTHDWAGRTRKWRARSESRRYAESWEAPNAPGPGCADDPESAARARSFSPPSRAPLSATRPSVHHPARLPFRRADGAGERRLQPGRQPPSSAQNAAGAGSLPRPGYRRSRCWAARRPTSSGGGRPWPPAGAHDARIRVAPAAHRQRRSDRPGTLGRQDRAQHRHTA
jgi:hypothetical protein